MIGAKSSQGRAIRTEQRGDLSEQSVNVSPAKSHDADLNRTPECDDFTRRPGVADKLSDPIGHSVGGLQQHGVGVMRVFRGDGRLLMAEQRCDGQFAETEIRGN